MVVLPPEVDDFTQAGGDLTHDPRQSPQRAVRGLEDLLVGEQHPRQPRFLDLGQQAASEVPAKTARVLVLATVPLRGFCKFVSRPHEHVEPHVPGSACALGKENTQLGQPLPVVTEEKLDGRRTGLAGAGVQHDVAAGVQGCVDRGHRSQPLTSPRRTPTRSRTLALEQGQARIGLPNDDRRDASSSPMMSRDHNPAPASD